MSKGEVRDASRCRRCRTTVVHQSNAAQARTYHTPRWAARQEMVELMMRTLSRQGRSMTDAAL